MISLAEALIIVAVIVLMIYVTKRQNKQENTPQTVVVTPESTTVAAQPAASTSENLAMAENLRDYDPTTGEAECFNTGAGDVSFNDYIIKMSVDPQVQRNHDEFAKDRMNTTQQNFTGRTYAMGEIESDDGIKWQGIRGRPQAIPASAMGNPTQVADVRSTAFSQKRKFVY